MNTSISGKVRTGLVVAVLGASSANYADTLIVTNHNASTGPKHDAMAHCLEAVKREVGEGHMLIFSNHVTTVRTDAGRQVFLVGATVWDNGALVPIEGRCEKGASGQVIVTVSRVQSGEAIAVAKR